jgi:ATP-dependent Clp protease adapter protein ClpS
VVPTLTRSKAWECTLAAHSHDFATIAIVTKGTAEDYCMKLQKAGLTISVAPDSNFKKDGEEGGGGGPQFNGGKK